MASIAVVACADDELIVDAGETQPTDASTSASSDSAGESQSTTTEAEESGDDAADTSATHGDEQSEDSDDSGIECDPGWGDCNGDAQDGCETDLLETEQHCGICNSICDDGQLCRAGKCVNSDPAGLVWPKFGNAQALQYLPALQLLFAWQSEGVGVVLDEARGQLRQPDPQALSLRDWPTYIESWSTTEDGLLLAVNHICQEGSLCGSWILHWRPRADTTEVWYDYSELADDEHRPDGFGSLAYVDRTLFVHSRAANGLALHRAFIESDNPPAKLDRWLHDPDFESDKVSIDGAFGAHLYLRSGARSWWTVDTTTEELSHSHDLEGVIPNPSQVRRQHNRLFWTDDENLWSLALDEASPPVLQQSAARKIWSFAPGPGDDTLDFVLRREDNMGPTSQLLRARGAQSPTTIFSDLEFEANALQSSFAAVDSGLFFVSWPATAEGGLHYVEE